MGELQWAQTVSTYGSQRVRTLKRGEAPTGQVSIKTLSSPAQPRRNVQQQVEEGSGERGKKHSLPTAHP